MTYVVTGASGTLGRLVAEELAERTDPSEVVLVTRSPEKLAEQAARGFQVRAGDFDDPVSLDEAFAGGDRLLLISTDAVGNRVPQHETAIEAAKRAGVSHILYTSVVNPDPDSPVGVNPDHHATEELLEASGIPYTALRNSVYSEMQVPDAQASIATGKFVHNHGDGRFAPVSRSDCAAAAAGALVSDGTLEKTYDVTGPELVDAADQARIYGELGGVEVEAVDVDDDTLIAGLVEHGIPAEVAPLLASFGAGIRGDHIESRTDAVELLSGRAAETLKESLGRALGD